MANNYFTNQYHDYGVLPYPNASNKSQFLSNIEFLQEKINSTTRNVSYWDLYKISTILSDPNRFQSAINDLLPYSSLVVNTRVFGKWDCSPGDLIIKKNDGSVEKITAERGGIFWPQKITKDPNNYNYSFEFYYSASAPTEEEKEVTASNNAWDASSSYAKKIVFKNLLGDSVGSPYNQYQIDDIQFTNTLTAATRLNSSGQTVPIEPVVKCFCERNDEGVTKYEEVYCDLKIQYTTSSQQYTIKLGDEGSVVPPIISKMVVK